MKLYAILTLMFLLMFTPLTFASNEVIAKAHRATHEIEMSTILDDTACSATAIGPYALLTASHCEEPNENITVDGDTPAKIVGIMRDGNDHSIYFLLMEKSFAAWAQVADALPETGEAVFVFGNPGQMTDVYRQGYVSKIKTSQHG